MKTTLASVLAAAVLFTSAMALRVYDRSTRQAKKEVAKTERRVLPVLIFSGVQMVWKFFQSDDN